MDNVKPIQIVKELISSGAYKSTLPLRDLLIRGFLSGAILSYATIVAATVASQSQMNYLGALFFPVGFVMVMLLGLELVTGNFATLPMAVMDKQTNMRNLAYNWFWVFTANLIGALFVGFLFAVYITKMGSDYNNEVANRLIAIASDKTLAYKELGSNGMIVVTIKAILCNWMVTMGVVMATTSTATIGKIFAIWLPIFTFFSMGLEHSVVNMFVIPTAIMVDGPISISDWWIWNQIPVTIGNILGGFIFTGLFLYLTYNKK